MHEIYLKANEVEEFSKLGDVLKDGWEIKEEDGAFQDTPEHMFIRFDHAKLYDPALINFRDEAFKCSSAQEVQELIDTRDFSSMSQADFPEICFAMGPEVLSGLIVKLIPEAKTDEDVALISALSVIRHNLYESLEPLES